MARNRSGSEKNCAKTSGPASKPLPQSSTNAIREHFEGLKAKEQENLEAKTAICEQIENIDFPALKSFKDWEEKNKEVIALQDKWKTIGFAPKKSNVKIFERFRAACDVYFNRKSEFYKNIKDEMEKNLALKKSLV